MATCLIAESTNSALEQFHNLQAKLHTSHIANDWQSNLLAAKELSKLLNESPGSLVEVARAQVHIGDLKAAFQGLEQFARMGQSIDLPPDFAPLLTKPEFAGIEPAMEANRGRSCSRPLRSCCRTRALPKTWTMIRPPVASW